VGLYEQQRISKHCYVECVLGTLAVVDGAISKLNYVSRITNKIAYKASAKAMDKEKEKNKQKFNDAINFDDFVTK
jgi:hypothetical protein